MLSKNWSRKINSSTSQGKIFRFPLVLSLIIIFLTLNLIFLGGIITYNYAQNGVLAYEYKTQSLKSTAYRLSTRIDALFRPLYQMVNRAESIAWSTLGEPFPIESQIEMAQIMRTNPQISSVYFAAGDDEFIQISSVLPGNVFERGLIEPPDGAEFAIRHLQGDSGNARREVWSFLDGKLRLMGEPIRRTNLYDPTSRPWYKAAMQSNNVVISEPYPFLSIKSVGITASRKVLGWDGGVFGIDLTLKSLSEALARLDLREHASAVIFSENGALLAANQFLGGNHPGDQHVVAKVSPSGDPLIRALFAMRPKQNADLETEGNAQQKNKYETVDGIVSVDNWYEFAVNDQDFVGQIIPLSDDFTSPTFLGFAVPKKALLTDVEHVFKESLIVSAIFLSASIFFTTFIARALTKPISLLADDTRRIQQFELNDPSIVTSNFSEIDDLGHSIGAMKKTLRYVSWYIPEVIVRKLIQEGKEPTLGGDTREVTIMFTDVANFTSLSELMKPSDLMRKLSSYLDCFSREIRAEHGIVDKFIGDAVMAVWNAFGDQTDHAYHACIAALRCCEANDKLNETWRGFGWPEMNTRIGIHLGDAIIGNIGSAERMEYTTIGATVNTATRLEGMNKIYGTRLLVSEDVYLRVQDQFLMRPVDIVIPKGNSKPIEVYELAGTLQDNGTITASTDDRRRFALWQSVYTHLRTKNWDGALRRIIPYLEKYPNDHVAQVYMARIREEMSLLENESTYDV